MQTSFQNQQLQAWADANPNEVGVLWARYEHHCANGGQASFDGYLLSVLNDRGVSLANYAPELKDETVRRVAQENPAKITMYKAEYEQHIANGGKCTFDQFAASRLVDEGGFSIFPDATMN